VRAPAQASAGEVEPFCGDGVVGDDERCNDDNIDGDGCAADCSRWDYWGVATEVTPVQLVGWSPCWSATYTQVGAVSEVQESCKGSELLMLACRKVGEPKYTAVAHASTTTIFTATENPLAYFQEHGSTWRFYTPKGPGGHLAISGLGGKAQCQAGYGLCWPIDTIGDAAPVWSPGGHCGGFAIGEADGKNWEKVVFQIP